VKVLDFGLARIGQSEAPNPSLSTSPTLTIAATSAGVIMGTAAYMSPEQARGRPVDRRADIWAFGVVLFGMLTGRTIFQGQGDTVTDTLAKILEREPDWSRLPPSTPATIRQLLQRCLMKNPKSRLQSIGDARLVIEDLLEKPEKHEELSQVSVVRPEPYPLWKRVLPWAAVPVALAAGLLLRPAAAPADRPLLQFAYPLPAGHALQHLNRRGLDVSPDGRRVAFAAAAASGGPPRIFVRNLSGGMDTPVEGTDGARSVFFSPDGEWLGFQQGQQIKKVALAGGNPVVVVENLDLDPNPDWGPPGISWGQNRMIVFAANLGSGLRIVRDTGGTPEEFTQLNRQASEASHRLPHFFPDGGAVVFTVLPFSAISPDWKRAQIWVKSLQTGERKRVLDNAVDARYVGDDTLILFTRCAGATP
jgi:hypothetical protein